MAETRTEQLDFLRFALARVVKAAGGSAEHAACVADGISFAHIQGKLNQGLGVYEVLDLALELGVLDMSTTPEVVNEGPAWAVVDGHASSGYYALNIMADIAIEKARTSGIAIVYGGNHNDAGSFASYAYKAHQQDMIAMTSNNTPTLTAPFGSMHNHLSCPPFDAIIPSGTEPPIWASLKFAEFYDADISEAVLNDKPMRGKWLIDPESGELTDNAKPYARPFEGYGRVWDYECGGQIESPRTYALNLWNEGMTAIANPIGIPANQISIGHSTSKGAPTTTVGGSYYMCINPAVFGPIEALKAKSDEFVNTVRNAKPRPGHEVRIPGATAYNNLSTAAATVEVLANHWQPFFENIAGKYGLSEALIRAEFEQGNT